MIGSPQNVAKPDAPDWAFMHEVVSFAHLPPTGDNGHVSPSAKKEQCSRVLAEGIGRGTVALGERNTTFPPSPKTDHDRAAPLRRGHDFCLDYVRAITGQGNTAVPQIIAPPPATALFRVFCQ